MSKKYKSQIERKLARKQVLKRAEKKRGTRLAGKYWRLVVPALTGYGVNPKRSNPELLRLKQHTLDQIDARQKLRGLIEWCVAWQTHTGSGLPHLDILLIYDRRVQNPATRYDYLVKHGHLTKYRSVNKAILSYGLKQDRCPLTNLDVVKKLKQVRVKTGLYEMLQAAMLEDPFEFQPHQWLHKNDLYRAISKTGWTSAIRLVGLRQQVVCNEILRNRPGIRLITRELIETRLSAQQLAVYDGWTGYGVIVQYINQVATHGGQRAHKMKNLLLVGVPNTGKTALALKIEQYCPVYYKGVSTWFPSYKSGVYKMTLWNEFTLRGMPFSDILNFLEGTTMDLQYKGGMTRKTDNPLVYMTSNWSLEQHICKRFKVEADCQHARLNLRVRMQQVAIPEGLTLFLLLKLIVKKV